MDLFWMSLAGVLGLLALFGGLGLLMWIDGRGKAQERQLAHAERLRALELGQPLPDAEVARARADTSRAWAVALVALLVPLGLAGGAVGATALLLERRSAWDSLMPPLATIWGVCGVVSIVVVSLSFGALRRRKEPRGHEDRPPRARYEDLSPAAIQAADRAS